MNASPASTAEQALSLAFVQDHPDEVATLLEAAPTGEAVELLAEARLRSAAAVLERMETLAGAACLAHWPGETGASLLEGLPTDSVLRLLRATDPGIRARLLGLVGPDLRASLESALRYPDGTAGALMDPRVFTLPDEIPAGEARRRIRRSASAVREYIYVVDRTQVLRGVLDLRDLLLAGETRPVAELVRGVEARLTATMPAAAVHAHTGWQRFRALPVVDAEERLLGALSLSALSGLDRARRPGRVAGPSTIGVGLAHLWWTAGALLLDATLAAAADRADPGARP